MSTTNTVVFCAFVLGALVLGAVPAAADASFESSTPADGSVLDEAVATVALTFSDATEPAGSGFQALDGDGAVRVPTDVSSADGATWELTFDPPLTGDVIVRWEVKAADAHVIEGAVSFETPIDDIATDSSGAAERPPVDVSRDSSADVPTAAAEAAAFRSMGGSGGGWKALGLLARAFGIIGTLVGVGAVAFDMFVLRPGEVDERRYVVFWIRRVGLAVVVGALLEIASQVGVEGNVGSVVFSPFGLASTLRLGGGALLLRAREESSTPTVAERVSVVATAGVTDPSVPSSHVNAQGFEHLGPRRSPIGFPRGALIGAISVLIAYLFDGHTVTKGWRPLTALVDLVHVIAASVWVGGVVMLAGLLWTRRVRDDMASKIERVLSFSGLASVALASVAVAGIALTATIVDSMADLFSTQWGRVLVAKVVLVGVAASSGAYNHFRLLPLMRNPRTRVHALREVKEVVLVEVAALVSVAGLSAWLVGSSL